MNDVCQPSGDEGPAIVLEEYKLSKTSIHTVMGQLTGVAVGVLGLSAVILRFGNDVLKETDGFATWYMVLLLLNFLVAYVAYQNVQIVALQKHIARLERRMGDPEIFRWESVVARLWYDLNHFRSIVLNGLLIAPPAALMFLVYYGLYLNAQWTFGFYGPLALNFVYFVLLASSFFSTLKAVDELDHQAIVK